MRYLLSYLFVFFLLATSANTANLSASADQDSFSFSNQYPLRHMQLDKTSSFPDNDLSWLNDQDDENDDAPLVIRKTLPLRISFSPILQVQQAGYSCCLIKQPPYCKHFSYLSAEKHIFQRVLRV